MPQSGQFIGGILAQSFGPTAPWWFAFAGSALTLALVWRSISHIAAAKPGVLHRDEVDPADLDKEREILRAQALNDPKPKPANIIEKMVEGRIAKYYKEVCLLEQPFVKNPDQSIEQMLKEHGDVELVAFVRFEMGEGLQKRQDNFAEEVMGQMKK